MPAKWDIYLSRLLWDTVPGLCSIPFLLVVKQIFGTVRAYGRAAGVHFMLLADTRVITSSRCMGQRTGARASLQLQLQRPKTQELPIPALPNLGDVSRIHLCDYSPFLAAE